MIPWTSGKPEMAVIVPGKLLFLAHPRTASNAIRNALLNYSGAELIYGHHARFTTAQVQDVYRGERVVSVVRNPYTCLVTWWIRQARDRGHKTSLAEFIRTYEGPFFTYDGLLFYHVPYSHTVIRYEDGIEEGFRSIGVEIDLKPSNVTKLKGDWRSYYDREALIAVRDRFGAEIESLCYSLEQP